MPQLWRTVQSVEQENEVRRMRCGQVLGLLSAVRGLESVLLELRVRRVMAPPE